MKFKEFREHFYVETGDVLHINTKNELLISFSHGSGNF